MSDHNEGESKPTAEEHHHHAQQAPLVVHGEGQVLSKEEDAISQRSERSPALQESSARVKGSILKVKLRMGAVKPHQHRARTAQ